MLDAKLVALEVKLVAQMAELRGEMAALRGEMARGFQVQTWRLLGAIFVAFGLFATLVRVS